MNVLLVTGRMFPDETGGLARVVTEHARRLSARGHRVSVVTRNPGGLPPEEDCAGVRIHRFRSPARPLAAYHAAYLAGAWLAGRVARRMGAEVVEVHHPLLGALMPGATPRVYYFHSSWVLEWQQEESHRLARGRTRALAARAFGAYLRCAEARAVRRARYVVVLSRFSATLARSELGIAARRLALVPGSVDLARFAPGEADRTALGLWPSGPLLVAVRRLVPRMGLELLLEALARLDPSVRLAIAGAGPLAEPLAERARALGLAERVRFLGRVSEEALPLLYRAATVSVVPSVAYEGFGLVVLESLASGTPVVATPVGALGELLGALDPALVAREASAPALADALASALHRAPRAEACRAHAEHYAPQHELDRLEALYRAAQTPKSRGAVGSRHDPLRSLP